MAGEFSALDAFYAPVITRIQTYKLPVSEDTAPYMQRIRQHPSVKKWREDAIESAVFRDFEEPYRFNSKDIPDPAEFFVKESKKSSFLRDLKIEIRRRHKRADRTLF